MCPMGLTTAPICLQPCQNCQNPKPCCVFMPQCPRDSRLYAPCTGCQAKHHHWALQHTSRACTFWMDPKVLCCLGCPRLLGMHMPNGLDASMSPCASVVQEAHFWGWETARIHGSGNPCLMLACMGMLAVWNLEHKGRALFLPLSSIQIIQQAQSIKFQPYTVLAVPKACPCCKTKTSKAVGTPIHAGDTQAIGCGNPTLSWLF